MALTDEFNCSVWYETTDDCYVTEWDIIDGNCKLIKLYTTCSRVATFTQHLDTDVLPYCGKIPETYTKGPSRTVYNTECNIIPEFVAEPADHTKMYKPEVDLTLTCQTTEGDAVLGNTYVVPLPMQ